MANTRWADHYRPMDLRDMALDPECRKLFEMYLSGSELTDSLLLYGPPGCGKTTIANIIAHKLYENDPQRVLRVSSGQSNNVEHICTKVVPFMSPKAFAKLSVPRLVIVDEASRLSPQAQESLRGPLETEYTLSRVIFLTNHIHKIDKPLRERFVEIKLGRPSAEECASVLAQILKLEGLVIPFDDVLSYTCAQFIVKPLSPRRLLTNVQQEIRLNGSLPKLEPQIADAAPAESIEDVWQMAGRAAEQTDGSKLLNDLAAQFSKYLSLPRRGEDLLALWSVFACAHEAFSFSPILALVSPTMESGKSTVFEMLQQLLVPETHHASSMTPAVVYRLKGLADGSQAIPPTIPTPPALCLLIDEADHLKLGGVLLSVLNGGHTRRSAFVPRTISTTEVGKYSCWYPKAIALIGTPPLPDTLRSRSIILPMQRKPGTDSRPDFPRHQTVPELADLRERIASWVVARFTELRELGAGEILADKQLKNRAKDNWHPLMCIASVAGGDWEQRARQASLTFSPGSADTEPVVELLYGIRQIFEEQKSEELKSVVLVDKLIRLEGSPWKEKRLTPRKLAQMLRAFGIEPRQIYVRATVPNIKGYRRGQFENAFRSYLEEYKGR